jgi:hypothetical protein
MVGSGTRMSDEQKMEALGETAEPSIRSYASVPMLRFAYRVPTQRAPWLSFDPELKDDCSTAVRAVRLVLLALFAFLVGPLESRSAMADEVPEAASLQLSSAAHHVENEKQNARAAPPRHLRQNRPYALITDAVPALAGPTQRAVSDPKRDALHLIVKHEHGPPAAANHTDHGLSCLHGLSLTFPSHHPRLSQSHIKIKIIVGSGSFPPIDVVSCVHSPALLHTADSLPGAYLSLFTAIQSVQSKNYFRNSLRSVAALCPGRRLAAAVFKSGRNLANASSTRDRRFWSTHGLSSSRERTLAIFVITLKEP